jgi:hypothetical protein
MSSWEPESINPREVFEEFWQSWVEPEASAYRTQYGYQADLKGDFPKLPAAFSLFGLALVGISGWIALSPLQTLIGEGRIALGAIIGLIIALPFLIYGLKFLLPNLGKLLGFWSTESADLTLQDSPQRLGQELRISYRLRTKGRTTISSLEARVSCIEQIRRPRHNWRRNDWQIKIEEHVVWQQDLPVLSQDVSLEQFNAASYQLFVPHQLPASFEAPNNKIVWRIEFVPKTSGWGKIRHSYRLHVLPEVIR